MKAATGMWDLTRLWQLFHVARFGFFLLLMVLVARSGLSLDEIGVWETFLFMPAVLSAFWISGLMNSMLTLYHGEQNKGRLIFSSFILLLGFSALIIIIMIVLRDPLSDLFSRGKEVAYYEVIMLFLFLHSPGFLAEHICLVRNDRKGLIIMGAVTMPLMIVMVMVPVYLGGGLTGAVHGMTGMAGIKFLWTLIMVVRHGEISLDTRMIRQFTVFSLPVILTFFLGRSAEYIDGVIVVNMFNRETFTLFRYGARELPFTFLLANALSAALIPKLSASLQEGMAELRGRSLNLMHWFFPVSIGLIILSPWLYPFVFGQEFAGSAKIFNIYLLLITTRLVFPQTILTASGRTIAMLSSSVIETAVNIGLSFWFAGLFGFEGVAYATVIAFAVDKAILMAYVRSMGIRPSEYVRIGWLTAYSLILLAAYFLMDFAF